MNSAFPLGLTFQLGLYADAGPNRFRLRFEANWGKTEVFASNAVPWDLTHEKSWAHHAAWTLWLAQSLASPYDVRLEAGHRAHWGDMRRHRHTLRMPYGERPVCRRSWRCPWWLTEPVGKQHVMGYAVAETDPARSRMVTSWAVLADQSLQAVANTPELTWRGLRIAIDQATLSCDEESPVWIATLELAQVSDFAAMGIGDPIELTLGLETFRLVVDGKTLSRDAQTGQRCEISAVSPAALLDAPFAGTTTFYRPEATSARTAVEALVGPVDWQLPGWVIPAGRLLLENVTPLAAARNLVSAIGGIVESNPDGSMVCRRRHPVSIPQYASATVAHSLFDADVLTASSRIAPSRGYNRVTLANEDGVQSGSSDTFEYLVSADDPRQGRVRAYVRPEHDVRLTHTGHPATVVTAQGVVQRSETELVEFIEGKASVRYPVVAITQAIWQHADLGNVSADGQSLAATVPGYSLLSITYTTQSRDWDVALAVDEEVQFVLVEA